MSSKDLSIVIPFYNDEGCAEPFVTELKKELEGMNYELVLVDDCSTDSTCQELDKLADERVRVIHNKWNMDYGGAIMTGFKIAEGNIICFTCGDGEVTPKAVVNVYKLMNDCEVIKAVRIKRKDGLIRRFLSTSFNLFTDFRFCVGLRDVNGYPVFIKREIYESLPNIRKDWLFNLDLYRKIIARNHKIREVCVEHKSRLSGKSHMSQTRITKMIIKYFIYR